ncbi:MAG: hypothetical protein IT366_12885 [Candidatus Hydrogenedentes bacterium]|nr:hypothetical protein [Candidatus Hydrogenedentota bacterium]
MTRNSHDAGEFIPAGMRYNIVLTDPVNGLERIAQSNVWNAWPDVKSREAVLQKLREDPGVPRWILNNLLTQRLYLAGDDVREFSDVLAITQMSRIGTMLERFLPYGSDVEKDHAGGLNLRHVPSSDIYYAVRGRVLILSKKRDVLIRALTLRGGDSLTEEAIDNLQREGAEDMRGTVQLAASDPLGDAFSSIAFAIRIDDDTAYAKCHAIIHDAARDRFGPLLNGAKPYALEQPLPGMIELSANFGKPLREVWASLGEALQISWLNAAQWQAWETMPADSAPTLAQTITSMIGPLGPSMRLTCAGFDVNEMFPVPVFVGTLRIPAEAVPSLAALPPPPAAANPWDSFARYNADKQLASIPLAGGPSLEPAAKIAGRDLVIGTSRVAVEKIASEKPPMAELPEQANLYLRLNPPQVVREGVTALRLFAEMDMLRGYDLQSFDEAAKGWETSAARVQEVVLIASGTDAALDVELRVMCNAPGASPKAESAP